MNLTDLAGMKAARFLNVVDQVHSLDNGADFIADLSNKGFAHFTRNNPDNPENNYWEYLTPWL